MLGARVRVYRSDGFVFSYRIFKVKRHATSYRLADNVARGEQRLILQTSEGPRGTVAKLQIAARLIGQVRADMQQANPRPRPRVCS